MPAREQMAELYDGFYRAVVLLRDEVEARRRRHQALAAARFGQRAERAVIAETEAEWTVGKLDALVRNYAPERLGVPPWTA
jgi:hypothetical protein